MKNPICFEFPLICMPRQTCSYTFFFLNSILFINILFWCAVSLILSSLADCFPFPLSASYSLSLLFTYTRVQAFSFNHYVPLVVFKVNTQI